MPRFTRPQTNAKAASARYWVFEISGNQTKYNAAGDHIEWDVVKEHTNPSSISGSHGRAGFRWVNPSAKTDDLEADRDLRAGIFNLDPCCTWRVKLEGEFFWSAGGSKSVQPTISSGSAWPVSGTLFNASENQDNSYANTHIWYLTPSSWAEKFKVEFGPGTTTGMTQVEKVHTRITFEEWI